MMTTSFTASPTPFVFVRWMVKVQRKFLSASIAPRLSMANMIFLGYANRAFATWRTKDMLLPLIAVVKMVCFATSLAPLLARLILPKHSDTPNMIFRWATMVLRDKTCSRRSAQCLSKTWSKTSLRIYSMGQYAKPASMALEICRATILSSLFSI